MRQLGADKYGFECTAKESGFFSVLSLQLSEVQSLGTEAPFSLSLTMEPMF